MLYSMFHFLLCFTFSYIFFSMFHFLLSSNLFHISLSSVLHFVLCMFHFQLCFAFFYVSLSCMLHFLLCFTFFYALLSSMLYFLLYCTFFFLNGSFRENNNYFFIYNHVKDCSALHLEQQLNSNNKKISLKICHVGTPFPLNFLGGNAVPTQFLRWERRFHAFRPTTPRGKGKHSQPHPLKNKNMLKAFFLHIQLCLMKSLFI